MMRFRLVALAGFLAIAAGSSPAAAGGYDTPILYTARHLGMGGTAIGYVDDPSAIFHNVAGLRHTKRFSLLGNVSLLLGNITGSPAADAIDVDSETTVAPFFLVGASARVNDYLTMGFAVYPVASAGGTYLYPRGGSTIEDSTTLIFLEASYGVAVEIPKHNLSFGAGYRLTYVSLTRQRGPQDGPKDTDFSANGWNFAGFRFGMQWQPIPEFEFGASYRHATRTRISQEAEQEDGICSRPPCALGGNINSIETHFRLPSRLGMGTRLNLGAFSAAFDLEYTFQSQNESEALVAEVPGLGDTPVPNIFDWRDGFTMRFGLEYRLLEGKLPLRVGYALEDRVTSFQYVSAFGGPPGATHVATLGAGYQTESFRVDVAYAFRTSKGTATAENVGPERSPANGGLGACAFCGFQGDYALTMHGIYVNVSYSWGASEPEPEAPSAFTPAPAPTPLVEPAPVEAPPLVDPEPFDLPSDETEEAEGVDTEDGAEGVDTEGGAEGVDEAVFE